MEKMSLLFRVRKENVFRDLQQVVLFRKNIRTSGDGTFNEPHVYDPHSTRYT